MDDAQALSDQYRMASPWPLFVALGIPIAELGILFDIFALAVGGLLLFSGSVAGMTREAGYADTPWGPLVVLGFVLLAVGGAFILTDLNLQTRGTAIVVSGGLLLFGSVVGFLVGLGESAY